MRWLKSGLKLTLFGTGIATVVAQLRRRTWILMLHGIGKSELDERTFEALVTYLRSHFRVISLEQAITELQEPHCHSLPAVVLTFDDGLRNNVTRAYPVLRRHQAPATYFVCPGLIEANAWQWTHEARARLGSVVSARFLELARGCGFSDPTGNIEDVMFWLKQLEMAARLEALAIIRRETPTFSPSAAQRDAYDVASWAELDSLDPDLITIGSHSWNHEIMRGLDAEQLRREVVDSKREIERKLNRRVDFFCYPNGDYDAATLAAVRSCYKAALGTRSGAVVTMFDPHRLPRVSPWSDVASLAVHLACH